MIDKCLSSYVYMYMLGLPFDHFAVYFILSIGGTHLKCLVDSLFVCLFYQSYIYIYIYQHFDQLLDSYPPPQHIDQMLDSEIIKPTTA